MVAARADTGSSFTGNTVIAPNLANGIAVYGGTDLQVRDNLVADTNALGSGIAISNQAFAAPFFPLSGTIEVTGNELVRTGAMNPNRQHPMGALRVDAYDSPIEAEVRIAGTTATGSPYSVFEFSSGGGQGHEVAASPSRARSCAAWARSSCRPRPAVRPASSRSPRSPWARPGCTTARTGGRSPSISAPATAAGTTSGRAGRGPSREPRRVSPRSIRGDPRTQRTGRVSCGARAPVSCHGP
ncbi:hypothetical protein [Saccharopolyspora gregorii]|uniref:hypothetical protein n=1 Tax=Saccharopolyspora gregorii TaxID=33914 RepID=UPI0031E5A3BE